MNKNAFLCIKKLVASFFYTKYSDDKKIYSVFGLIVFTLQLTLHLIQGISHYSFPSHFSSMENNWFRKAYKKNRIVVNYAVQSKAKPNNATLRSLLSFKRLNRIGINQNSQDYNVVFCLMWEHSFSSISISTYTKSILQEYTI